MAICTNPTASLQNTDCSVAKRRQSSSSALVIFEEERPQLSNLDGTDVIKTVNALPKAEPSINDSSFMSQKSCRTLPTKIANECCDKTAVSPIPTNIAQINQDTTIHLLQKSPEIGSSHCIKL
ncbi:hypothetical protein Ddc_08097 [Ditylenchus destructor]|nr:hypothetical protein Ddc_08097 [Ditylenchus destructor]